MSSWSAALRIARRDARRARGRSALVLAMVALPVLGVTAADVLLRTYELSPEQQAVRQLGAADVAVTDIGQSAVEQQPGSSSGWSSPPGARPRAERVDPAGVLPAGSRVVPDVSVEGRVSAGPVARDAQLRELPYDDPLAAGLYAQAAGRAPAAVGEAALTTALAQRLGVGVGGTVQLASGPLAVVGTLHDADRRDAEAVLLEPGTLPTEAGGRLLVDLPDGALTWDLVRAANATGVVVETRTADVPGAPALQEPSGTDVETLTAVGLVVGMALLEVVLLAGPAFAVGAKRQERVLALLAATGADRRDVRRTVLASGVVLGLVAALAGAVGGVLLAAGVLPLLPRWTGAVPGPFDLRPLEVAGVALLGAATAVAAALLPAFTASRQDVVAALTGRRGVRRSSVRLPLLGLVAAGAGAAIAWQGALVRDVNVVLAGAVVAELGLVATTPALVGLAGRLGPLLPAAPRLALRDAARNRSRTAPAVAAVLAAVAGSVAIGTFMTSLDEEGRRDYLGRALPGTLTVSTASGEPPAALVEALARELPGGRPVVVQALDAGLGGDGVDPGWVEVLPAPGQACPRGAAGSSSRCAATAYVAPLSGSLAVGGADVARALVGPGVDARVLERGGVLVPAGSVRPGGTATLLLHPSDDESDAPRPVVLPAAALPAGVPQQPVVSEAAARELGRSFGPVGLAVSLGRTPSGAEEDRVRAAAAAVEPGAQVYVERGYRSQYGVELLVLLAASALLVLGASGIATGLAAADGRADLATLAAVGASPGLRRVLSGCQSVVTAGLGTVLGTAAGLVPAVGLIRAVNAPDVTGYVRPVPLPLVIPWSSIAVTLLVVPLLAGALAAALTRSRLPLVRRVA